MKERKEKFKTWWRKQWIRIIGSGDNCLVCNTPLKKNHPRHIVYYCSKECRHRRHNKND